MAAFNEILRTLRKERGLTQQQLADKLGVSYSTVSMYERGNRRPDLEMMARIAEFFGVTMDHLHGKFPNVSQMAMQDRLYAALRQLAAKQNLPYEEVLHWFLEGDKVNGLQLRDPTGGPVEHCAPSPNREPMPVPEELELSAHERAVIVAYRQRREVQPYVDKLLDVKKLKDI